MRTSRHPSKRLLSNHRMVRSMHRNLIPSMLDGARISQRCVTMRAAHPA
jgi:hypothetical protein